LVVQLPPQSTSVSLPFLIPSPHELPRQLPLEQLLLAQSVDTLQVLVVAQREQLVAPPQSTSDSPPFLTASEQVGARHVLVVPEQTPL
jgi:hypothetical protein